MPGTPSGGRKARDTNKTRYGDTFYKRIGAAGGKISRGGAFSISKEFASEMGRIGGKVSRRNKANAAGN